MNNSRTSPFFDNLRPYWASALLVVLIVGAVTTPGVVTIGPAGFEVGVATRWALLLMVMGGYACGLYVGAASARRGLARRSEMEGTRVS